MTLYLKGMDHLFSLVNITQLDGAAFTSISK
jgi:hypothetical protein